MLLLVGVPSSMNDSSMSDVNIAGAKALSQSKGQSTNTASNTPSSTAQPTKLVEVKLDRGFFRLEHPELEKPRHLTPGEKIALEKLDARITEQALSRQETCWSFGCENPAIVWVREVCFDFKGEKAAPIQHKQISSADYPGPVPGFCLHHQTDGPPKLAETIYWNRPEIAWGAKPTRWWVVFTDGLKQGGECISLDPGQRLPTMIES